MKTNGFDGKSISNESISRVRAEHMKASNTACAKYSSKLSREKKAARSATRDIRNKTWYVSPSISYWGAFL